MGKLVEKVKSKLISGIAWKDFNRGNGSIRVFLDAEMINDGTDWRFASTESAAIRFWPSICSLKRRNESKLRVTASILSADEAPSISRSNRSFVINGPIHPRCERN